MMQLEKTKGGNKMAVNVKMGMEEITSVVKRVVESEFNLELGMDTEISLDSIGIVKTIVRLEEELEISFDEDIVQLEHFSSIRKISQLISELEEE
jgi:acyl carrier protein